MSGLIFKKIIPIALLVLFLTGGVYILYSKHVQENTAKEILEAYKANDLNKLEELACKPDNFTNNRPAKAAAAVLYQSLKRANSEIVFSAEYSFPYTNITYRDSSGRELAFIVTGYNLFTNRDCFVQGAG